MPNEVLGADPSRTAPATDEVVDAIAGIETQRRETESEAGFPMSCSSALHRLHELLDHEKEALRLRGPAVGHPENVEAVTHEIGRVKGLHAATGRGPNGKDPYPAQRQATWQDASRGPVKSKGRRTMGRSGGR